MKIINVPYFALLILLASCNINSHILFKTPQDFEYTPMSEFKANEYVIRPNDIITFHLFTNDGFEIIDISSGQQETKGVSIFNDNNSLTYNIRVDGKVKLPIIGDVDITNKTLPQAEKFLEEVYAKYYVKPFAKIKVMNRRVMVFTGANSNGIIVPINNENTSIIESITIAGGLEATAKAQNIKLLRQTDSTRNVFKIDLSTITGVRQADLLVQANDIIYVEPRIELANKLITQVTPILTTISSLLILYVTIRRINERN